VHIIFYCAVLYFMCFRVEFSILNIPTRTLWFLNFCFIFSCCLPFTFVLCLLYLIVLLYAITRNKLHDRRDTRSTNLHKKTCTKRCSVGYRRPGRTAISPSLKVVNRDWLIDLKPQCHSSRNVWVPMSSGRQTVTVSALILAVFTFIDRWWRLSLKSLVDMQP